MEICDIFFNVEEEEARSVQNWDKPRQSLRRETKWKTRTLELGNKFHMLGTPGHLLPQINPLSADYC